MSGVTSDHGTYLYCEFMVKSSTVPSSALLPQERKHLKSAEPTAKRQSGKGQHFSF